MITVQNNSKSNLTTHVEEGKGGEITQGWKVTV